MDLSDFDAWCRSLLAIEALAKIDDSLNGVQVGRSDGALELVAFAVDACAESIRRAARAGAPGTLRASRLLLGRPARVEGGLLERIRLLLGADMAALRLSPPSRPAAGAR